jgi:two-component system osmolarity sensor histidine kinase EnvZ
MFNISKRLPWISSGLFWRTFFLLTFLITVSLAIWVSSISMVERAPRARQVASQIVSIVTVTRVAIANSAPELRKELLIDLKSNEGIKILPLEENDQIEDAPGSEMVSQIETNIRARLGSQTRFAGKVNKHDGFWISFDIEGDPYWLGLERERIERSSGIQWFGWAGVTLIISMLGAVFISGLINQPLARLTAATHAIAKGKVPEPLPEKGPEEIRETNRSFNQMVADLNRVESDRALVLAGISHDLRTPLARMQLEVEMAHLPDDARQGMQSDLHQMDAIIGQFLDYAKPTDSSTFVEIDLSSLLLDCAQAAGRMPDLQIQTKVADNVTVKGNPTDLKRVFNNLIENARRYGKAADSEITKLDIDCHVNGDNAVIKIADHGLGVPEADIERLLRPFTRLDTARGQANGAGLGLAIVDRVIRRHEGKMRVRNRSSGGLVIEIGLPRT